MVRLAFTPGASQALSVWIRAGRKMGGCANSDEPSVMLPTNKSCFLCILSYSRCMHNKHTKYGYYYY